MSETFGGLFEMFGRALGVLAPPLPAVALGEGAVGAAGDLRDGAAIRPRSLDGVGWGMLCGRTLRAPGGFMAAEEGFGRALRSKACFRSRPTAAALSLLVRAGGKAAAACRAAAGFERLTRAAGAAFRGAGFGAERVTAGAERVTAGADRGAAGVGRIR